MDLLKQISESLEQGDDEKVLELTRQAVDRNIPAKEILDRGLIAGMDAVGEKFGRREIFLPDVLLAARAMYAGMDVLRPLFVREGFPTQGKVVIGTVHGDLHDIGKNLVGVMLKSANFEVVDLGKDVSAQNFVETARSVGARVIGLSALLTTTMPVMKEVMELLAREGLKGKIKVIVGGAPVTDEFASEIGADAYGYDAAKAVVLVKELVREASA
jgi:5-methyltetrahydrofolate--homocysteine methyltransferase